jgi:hypothetical protein
MSTTAVTALAMIASTTSGKATAAYAGHVSVEAATEAAVVSGHTATTHSSTGLSSTIEMTLHILLSRQGFHGRLVISGREATMASIVVLPLVVPVAAIGAGPRGCRSILRRWWRGG